MQRKIFRSGNSMVVSLPKDYLELVGLEEGAKVSVIVDENENNIIISPITPKLIAEGVDEEFARQVSEFIERYRPALEALAKGE